MVKSGTVRFFKHEIHEIHEISERYEKILEQKKNGIDMGGLGLDQKIEKLKEKNLILSKENKSKEEIILNLKKTLEILEKNKNENAEEAEK